MLTGGVSLTALSIFPSPFSMFGISKQNLLLLETIAGTAQTIKGIFIMYYRNLGLDQIYPDKT